ncbi:UNVERIFIED_CONTAM: Amino acid transporter AVT1D [Sesamum latifolium]|uniref:Amino acid transporter AVT1D n=1 Tax=Sesamum latifolium TaxID=2727402 RepID=A0AAW2XBV9_9LAMI
MQQQLEKELGPDRAIEIETDDEENEAERVCNDLEYDTESDITGPCRGGLSSDCLDQDASTFWPQSYRRSMDMYTSMTPPSISYLKDNSFLASADKRLQTLDTESSLVEPLVSSTSVDRDFPSLIPVKVSTICELTRSVSELPPTNQCSYTQSLLNAINALCGIGILSTPYALREGGWFSILILFILGTITCYTGILLKRCLESSPHLQTYPDIGQAAFGLHGRICIAAVLYVELYSSCVEFLIMMSDNLAASFPNAQMDVAGIHLNSYQVCAIASTLVILPTVWLRNLSLLSFVSAGGVVTLALVVVCLLWVGVATDVGFHPSGKALDYTRLPITIGIYSFCYGSHSVFPNIYSSMKEPSRFPLVLVISFLVAASLYAGVAVCGFLMFGEATNPQFTLNLPTNFVASDIAAWSVVVAPLTKFALSITPVALGIEELLPADQLRSHTMSVLIRTCLVVSTLVVALAVPYFGSLMALIGSFLVMLVNLKLLGSGSGKRYCSGESRQDSGPLLVSKSNATSVLVLPLKTQEIQSPPSKLPFTHNVTLTVSLAVGTPPQNVTMVLDTGSELSWLQCNTTRRDRPVFDPTRSLSYTPIACSSPTCTTQTQDFSIPASCDSKNLCHAILSYADASSSEGNLAMDNFTFSGSHFPGTIFGCMDSGFSSNSDEDSKTTGLMGMNRGVAYTVQLEGIKVSQKLLQLPKSIFEPDHTGAGQTMVDSGTQFTFLLGPAYTALRNEFINQTASVLRVLEDPNFVFQAAFDLCFLIPQNSSGLPELPPVSLVFRGAEITVSGERLLYRVPDEVRGNDSVHCFTFGNSDLLAIEAYIIGHHHQQNIWMEFDLEKSRIGVAKVRCDLAGQRFGIYH